ncbi:MAG: transposase, partial [PVC group bacterium]|nr:transposase [PVC group bacterium]
MASNKSRQKKCSSFFNKLTGKILKKLLIRAGFPYYKAPRLYQWLPVFLLLPFLEEDTLNELSEKHGKELRKLYVILVNCPDAFDKLMSLLSAPLFLNLLEEFDQSDETGKSRRRIQIIIDDTQSAKFGKMMEFIHKLFDHCEKKYIMGYNYVLVLVSSGDFVFPLNLSLWLPKDHADHRSKNDIAADVINSLDELAKKNNKTLQEVEFTADSAYCVQKVIKAAGDAGLRVVTKPSNTHKFDVDGEKLTPKELIEKVKNLKWKCLGGGEYYQRITARHHVYGEVVLVVRKRVLKNGKTICDVIMCNRLIYTATRIDSRYRCRWEIEMHFKYYKQHLKLGKTQFRKIGAIR